MSKHCWQAGGAEGESGGGGGGVQGSGVRITVDMKDEVGDIDIPLVHIHPSLGEAGRRYGIYPNLLQCVTLTHPMMLRLDLILLLEYHNHQCLHINMISPHCFILTAQQENARNMASVCAQTTSDLQLDGLCHATGTIF